MYQIDESTAVTTQPTSTALGTVGYFTDGNAATGEEATIVPAEFLNAVMLELLNAVEGAGLTPSKSAFNQLFTAIQTIAQGGGANYAADTGAANSYAVTYTPAVSAPTDDMVRSFKVKTSNTGASTLALDGSTTTYPIVGLNGTALVGGELIATGIARVRFNSSLEAWVLLECDLGALQIVDASSVHHAASLSQVQSGLSSYVVDTGTANTYVATLAPALTAYKDGVKVRFRALTANTGASTLNVNGLGAKTLYGGAHSALVGGEIIAGGYCEAEYNGTLGAFVLLECTGAALQVSAGSGANQAVNYSQFAASIASAGYQKLPGGLIVQWGGYTFTSVSANTLTYGAVAFPISFPTKCLRGVASIAGGVQGSYFSGCSFEVTSTSAANLVYAAGSAVASPTVNYIAIGY